MKFDKKIASLLDVLFALVLFFNTPFFHENEWKQYGNWDNIVIMITSSFFKVQTLHVVNYDTNNFEWLFNLKWILQTSSWVYIIL
jgi:hypothetical protein